MSVQTSEYEAAAPASPNGVAADVPLGPRIPRREVWLDLPEEYAGFRIRVWVNYPRRLVTEMDSGETDRLKAALCQIVLEHNGWRGYDGEAYPPSTDEAFWDSIPDELAATVLVLLRQEAGKLPASLIERKRR